MRVAIEQVKPGQGMQWMESCMTIFLVLSRDGVMGIQLVLLQANDLAGMRSRVLCSNDICTVAVTIGDKDGWR